MSESANILIIPEGEQNPFVSPGRLYQDVPPEKLPNPRELTEQDTENIKNAASLIQAISLDSLNKAKTKGFELAFLLNKYLSEHDIDPKHAKIYIDDFLRGAEAVLVTREDSGDEDRVQMVEKAVAQRWRDRDFEEEEFDMRNDENSYLESEKYMKLDHFAKTATGLVQNDPITTEDVRAVALLLGEQIALQLNDVPFFSVERFIGTTWYSGHHLAGSRAYINGARARGAMSTPQRRVRDIFGRVAAEPHSTPRPSLFGVFFGDESGTPRSTGTPSLMSRFAGDDSPTPHANSPNPFARLAGDSRSVMGSPRTPGNIVSPANNVPFDLFKWAEDM